MTLIHPRHTFASVVKMLAQGLRDGSIVLDQDKESGATTTSPFENKEALIHEMARIRETFVSKLATAGAIVDVDEMNRLRRLVDEMASMHRELAQAMARMQEVMRQMTKKAHASSGQENQAEGQSLTKP